MAQTIPTQAAAGDSFSATLSGSTYPSSTWTASLILIGDSARHTVSTTASGDDHVAAATPDTTASWAAGTYQLQAIYTDGTDRASVSLGAIRILPDPAASGTTASSLLGPAQRAYADLLAAYRAHLAAGRWTVQEYLIAGRRMTFRTLTELRQALDAAKRDADAEIAAEQVAAGISPRRRFVVRM